MSGYWSAARFGAAALCLSVVLGAWGCQAEQQAENEPVEPSHTATYEPAAEPQPVATSEPAVTPVAVAAPAPAPTESALAVDPALPDYRPRTQVSSPLRSVGSDTMDKVMQYWEEAFVSYHPGIAGKIHHEGKGSSSAPPALAEGLSDFGPMSRKIKEKEEKLFHIKYGFGPTQLRVAMDSLAVYIHPSNPIVKRGMTFAELDAIFSSTRKQGAPMDITVWGQLGLGGEWANKPIIVYSRNKTSGTYGFFKDQVLKKGDYKTTNREMVGSEAVVEGVASNPGAIGYSGIGYKTDDVAVLPLAKEYGQRPVMPEPRHAYSGAYPLARFLYMTIVYHPEQMPLSDMHREFLRFVYSKQGQQLVIKDGYYPVSAEIGHEDLGKLGVN